VFSSPPCMRRGGDALTRRGNRCAHARDGKRCTDPFQTYKGYAACACCVLLIVVLTRWVRAMRALCSSAVLRMSRNRLQKRATHLPQLIFVGQIVRKPQPPIARLIVDFS
jgi:hypothetical protein